MRAFAIDAFSTPGSVHDLPRPTIGPDELLIRVHAAGVNPTDWKIRDRQMPVSAPQFPLVLGQDLAGIVEQVGTGVAGWAVGDEVFGIVRQVGTYAEEVAAPSSAALARKPRTLDFVHAAAMPTPALTALASLDAVALQQGESLLVVGATGGVGRYAVQLAARGGIYVIGTGRSRESLARLAQLGAAETIDYSQTDLASTVKAAHPDGIDAILDVASDRATLAWLAGVVRPGGRIASTVYAADEAAFATRGIRATNVRLGDSGFETASHLDELARLADAGTIVVAVERTYPLEEAAQALDANKFGAVFGKIVVTIS
ncbi:MAG: quinone oxidoreductase family protein [Ktedonobacterales bacterium]